MRSLSTLAITCLVAAPVLGGPVLYTFDVTAGSVIVDIDDVGSTTSAIEGTFALTLYQSDGHIGESDTFVLQDADLFNTSHMALPLSGIATSHLMPGSLRMLDFLPDGPAHIGSGGQSAVNTPLDVSALFIVTGAFEDTYYCHAPTASQLFALGLSTSTSQSDVVTASLAGSASWIVPIPDIGMTITYDLIIDLEGTAHVAPDPALGGLVALGVAGASARLRRRR